MNIIQKLETFRYEKANTGLPRSWSRMLKAWPANTVYEFVPEPNFAKVGTYKTWIRLLYPDNSMETSQEVTVSVYDHT